MSEKKPDTKQGPDKQLKDVVIPVKPYLPFNANKIDWGQHRRDCDFLALDTDQQSFQK